MEVLDECSKNRDEIIAFLNSKKILARPYYYPPLHSKIRKYEVKMSDLYHTDYLSKRYVNLPCGSRVDQFDVDVICKYIIEFCDVK